MFGRRSCHLQTGRGAAYELGFLSGTWMRQLPLPKSLLAKAKGTAMAAVTVPATM